ncbi:MAG: hypothetical protein LWW93_07840 [Hyphomicrobiales bacterium]|nr:hypothetical protein [Hyphomicrobiales bacterium]
MTLPIPSRALRHAARLLAAPAFALALAPTIAVADPTGVETILLLRHGEKPAAGLGQLDCRGLARSLALAAVFETRFGRPDAVFAPDPAIRKIDGAVAYSYVRPLATIEPTAVRFGLPVDTRFGWTDVAGLEQALLAPELASSRVVVAWEHKEIVKLAKRLVKRFGGDVDAVPKWPGSEFDRVLVLTIVRPSDGPPRLSLEVASQGLTDLPTTCPDR